MLCEGVQHIPVGPLSPHLEQMALLASDGKVVGSKPTGGAETGQATPSMSTTRAGHHPIKAFSGKGHTLSSSSGPTPQQPSNEDVLTQQRAALRLSSLKQEESVLQQQVSWSQMLCWVGVCVHVYLRRCEY